MGPLPLRDVGGGSEVLTIGWVREGSPQMEPEQDLELQAEHSQCCESSGISPLSGEGNFRSLRGGEGQSAAAEPCA